MKKIEYGIGGIIFGLIFLFFNSFIIVPCAYSYIDTNSSYYTTENPYYPEYGGQCTAFAWGRAYEKMGIKLKFNGTKPYPGAKLWWEMKPIDSLSISTGIQPRSNSIAVWEGDSSNPYGHVAFVERIENGTVYYNEANVTNYVDSNYGGGYHGKEESKSIYEFENRGSGVGRLVGYIYLERNIDVALIIDSSGSMSWNDPLRTRLVAAKIFIDSVDENDQISIIDFDNYAYVRWFMQPVGGNREPAKRIIDLIDSNGGTNLSAGLAEAYEQLNLSTENHKKIAIMMTDGEGYYHNEAEHFNSRGWPVYTVGLGYSVDSPLLEEIATITKGKYFHLQNPDQLKNIYFEMASLVEGGKTILNWQDKMQTGESVELLVHIPKNQQKTTFLTTWPGSEVKTRIYSPDGQIIDSDFVSEHLYYSKGSTYELFKIYQPMEGEWKVLLEGIQLEEGGETVSLDIATVGPDEPLDTTPPIISITNPIDGKVYFDSLPIRISYQINDPESRIIEQSVLLNGYSIESIEASDVIMLGENKLSIYAENEFGLNTFVEISFTVNDFEWMVKEGDIKSVQRSTVPIKFAVFDENGTFVEDTTVEVLVEGTTAYFELGKGPESVRISEEFKEKKYIVNLHTNFNKFDYGIRGNNMYEIQVYFDGILAATKKLYINKPN